MCVLADMQEKETRRYPVDFRRGEETNMRDRLPCDLLLLLIEKRLVPLEIERATSEEEDSWRVVRTCLLNTRQCSASLRSIG